ncbi:unnamed protein product [Urochloa humidicola]
MENWEHFVDTNVDSSELELDADDFQLGSLPVQQPIVEASATVKGNKKRSKNFSEKEDLLLVSAWLEISMDPVQSIDQTRATYWQRIHDYYHEHKDFTSERNINSLSHRWGIISASVSLFCGWYNQVQNKNQSGVTEQDKIQEACSMYKAADKHNKSFVLLHCWNMLRHTQKWLALPINNKRQKTSSNASPRSCTPGTNESHHADEEEGPCHTSPRKERPDGKKKEKARRGKSLVSDGQTFYMETMENIWAKKEKVEELKEIKKKERNDMRLAVETRRLELKHEVENKKLELMQEVENKKLELKQLAENRKLQELALKQRMDDEKIINMDLRGMSELQQKFYMDKQEEIITRRYGGGAS